MWVYKGVLGLGHELKALGSFFSANLTAVYISIYLYIYIYRFGVLRDM